MKKIEIDSKILLDVIEPLQAVINDTHVIPIYSCVKVVLSAGYLSATGDNAEVRCEKVKKLKSSDEIAFCVNFQMFRASIKSLKKQTLKLSVDHAAVTIEHDKGVFQVPAENHLDYPKDKRSTMQGSLKCEGEKLKESLSYANKFVLNDELDPFGNVLLEFGKKMTVRSTNRITMYREHIKVQGDKGTATIGAKAANVLQNLLTDSVVDIRFSPDRISVVSNNMEITIVQQQEKFPKEQFDRIIETVSTGSELKVDFDELKTSLRRALILSSKEKYNKVSFDISKKGMSVSSNNDMASTKTKENLSANFVKKLQVNYNPKTMLEIINMFGNKSQLMINDSNCLCIVKGKRTGIIAPMGG